MLQPLAATSSGGSSIGLLLPLLLVLLFFFLLIRPQRARQRQLQQVQATLQPGADVVTTGGMFGRVAAVDDESVTLEVSPGVRMRFLRGAIARVVTPQPEGSVAIAPEDRPGT